MILRYFTSKKRCLFRMVISIFFCVLCISSTAFAQEEISENELYALSAVLMDAKTGRVLYEKNGYEEMPMASTTKIMTCIIALESGKLDKVVEVSEYASSMPEVHLGMREGEQFVLQDLLYSLMLESHNDSAVAIAEGVSGTVEDFLKLMNEKAKELGCNNTLFLTPNGLDETITDENGKKQIHHTTAADLSRIMSYCINESPKSEEFLKITQTKQYSFSDVSGKRSFACSNHNSFLSMMEGALSGKTGFTAAAGYCYVGALRRDDKDLVVALLACGWPNNKSYKWSDTKKLMSYGLKSFSNRIINVLDENVTLEVEGGVYDPFSENRSTINASVETKSIEILLSDNDQTNVVVEIEKKPVAPINAGDVVGAVKYYVNDSLIYETALTSKETIQKKSLRWAIEEIVEMIFDK